MGNRNKRIDTYIINSADFAIPILTHLREVIHNACPAVEEKIKWGFPHFDYKSEMLCSMASFGKHCSFGFWKASLMKDKALMLNARSETAMGHLGKIASLKDLPSDTRLKAYIREAMKLTNDGVKVIKKKSEKADLQIPNYLIDALRKNKKAAQVFSGFSYSNKKEYVEWLTEAKTDETRNKRLQTTVEWLTEGKTRNWKYKKITQLT